VFQPVFIVFEGQKKYIIYEKENKIKGLKAAEVLEEPTKRQKNKKQKSLTHLQITDPQTTTAKNKKHQPKRYTKSLVGNRKSPLLP